ncbi:hypothetical protein CERZMDRAFT_103476 [Cercospora zeae-maydis SCOH1-5]|uniref:BTB domain-containing protein n=1 Tax=Cercospora zeae-maydis SCOH1-5 TaxID=717836 RepID=A0A6A6EXA3_9PEZI|nr:hypothetical protein CERZMDRAFT_103476 [Cercospora zeae-maydis SCOH1-5]
MDTISPKTLERLFRTHSLSSDTLHSLLVPANHEMQAQLSRDTPQLDTSPPATETAYDLLLRLRAPDSGLVRVQCTAELNKRPLLISRTLLERASPRLAAELKHHDTLRLDTNEIVYATFVYWLYHNRVPQPGDFSGDSIEFATDREKEELKGEFQVLLVQSWSFAEHWSIPRLQNAIMDTLFTTLTSEDMMHPKVMKACLEISRAKSAMRFALFGYMLWSDSVKQQHDPELYDEELELLMDTVDIREVKGFDEDFLLATELLVWRGREARAIGELADGEMPEAEKFHVPEG